MTETWKPIDNFPNYIISSEGRIKNVTTNLFLKASVKCGYYHLSLTHNKIRKTLKLHRLIALAFIENPENKSDVNHKDKNTLNNDISNLEWMTRKENNCHRLKDLVVTTNKNKPIVRICKTTNEILSKYNSIEDAANWAFNNGFTKNTHNGRNAIGNCITGLSKSAYGLKWELEKTVDNLEGEEWKQVIIEGINDDKEYYVSSLGRFKNSQGIIMDNYKVNPNGYIRVYIYNKTFALHRLIAAAFLENTLNKEQVNHIDGNKLNNAVNNLEWVTNQENQIHKYQNGLGTNTTKRVGQYTLDNVFIQEFQSIVSAAKSININRSGVSCALRGNRKTAGGFIWKYLD